MNPKRGPFLPFRSLPYFPCSIPGHRCRLCPLRWEERDTLPMQRASASRYTGRGNLSATATPGMSVKEIPVSTDDDSRAGRGAPRVSVLMPTFAHAPFIRRAIASLLAQTFADWELLVIDDGSPDETRDVVAPYLDDARIRYRRLAQNTGLGAALNVALAEARAPLIAYLPSDDCYFADHLATLVAALDDHPDAALAYAGVRYHGNHSASGQIAGEPLQLVQVMHRRTDDRWLERAELVTDDLERMYWAKLRPRGAAVGTRRVSCEWVNHPDQRHKRIREPMGGGINPYRSYYRVPHPLRFHSSVGNRFDEVAQYRRFRERPDTPPAPDGLKILLVGELAYNPERVLALEERGHRLYGLWTPDVWWFNTVGPLPFGHVEDLPRERWREAVRAIRPDIIYALLNWQAVPFAHRVLMENPGVPFVWHFKEGPWLCRDHGTWPALVDLHTRSDAQIYSSPEQRDWFETAIPGSVRNGRTLVIDGDLPKRDWFMAERAPLRSASDGEPHTLVAGRPIGLDAARVRELAAQGVHVHFYGAVHSAEVHGWIAAAGREAARYLHVHSNASQETWVAEFSQYDAGWLHFLKSENEGDLPRAFWDDLNYPARLATLMVSGVPLLQYDNRGAIFATQSLADARELGLAFTTMEELGSRLRDTPRMAELRESVWRQRETFTFDAHADRLIGFFRDVIGDRSAVKPR